MPAFKYREKIEALPDCPASECREDAREGFRFVFRGRMAESFAPVGSPTSAFKWGDRERCGGWALSFFSSVENAEASFRKMQRNSSNIHKKIGDSVASGNLQHSDGVMSAPEADGHFDLHEYEGTNLVPRFAVVLELV